MKLRVDAIEDECGYYIALVDEMGRPVLRFEPAGPGDEHGERTMEHLGLMTGDLVSLETEVR